MRGRGTRNIMAKVPDKWVIVEVQDNEGVSTWKILGSWYGGYGGSDSWQLSSGIVETTETDKFYEFKNHSGSIYTCHKSSYGMSMYTEGIFQYWQKEIKEQGLPDSTMRLLEEQEVKGIL